MKVHILTEKELKDLLEKQHEKTLDRVLKGVNIVEICFFVMYLEVKYPKLPKAQYKCDPKQHFTWDKEGFHGLVKIKAK